MTLTYPIRSSGLTDDTNHIVSAHTNYFNGHIFKEHRRGYSPRERVLYAAVTNRQPINDIYLILIKSSDRDSARREKKLVLSIVYN